MERARQQQLGQCAIRLRIAWGGGQRQQWRGTIEVDKGSLAELNPLGLQADSAQSCFLEDGRLTIRHPSARVYDAVDVSVKATRDSTLTIQLGPQTATADESGPGQIIELSLSDLLRGPIEKTLDLNGNRLLVRRVPGDMLRVRFQRPSLVFTPGEVFKLTAVPHLAGLVTAGSYRCDVQLLETLTGNVIRELEPAMTSPGPNRPATIAPIELTLPQQPGVYDVTVAVRPRRFTDRLIRSKVVIQRTVQLVVVGMQQADASEQSWTDVLELDPANPDWWHWLQQLTNLSAITGWSQEPVDNGKTSTVVHFDRSWSKLAAGGWQAIPLPIDKPGTVHQLTIEFPADLQQSLSISILEPDRTGKVGPFGPNASVQLTTTRWSTVPRVERQQLLFWPRSSTPFLLIHNSHKSQAALFGTIRMRQNSAGLTRPKPATASRLVSAYYDKPLFPENFGSSETLDPVSQTSLDDWQTFYQGGERLVQYLPYAGYNAAIVAIGCDGSFLYPSRLAPATPRYDSGVFFESGQDPVRKDVLEMLFRQFDREGLLLIPAIQFNAPLPQLEQLLREDPTASEGILLAGPNGAPWTGQSPSKEGLAPYYNPLDSRVQDAMRSLVREITARYKHHPSFAGIAIQLTPNSYTQLPDLSAGADARTVDRFRLRMAVESEEGEQIDPLADRWRDDWSRWRCNQLAELYRGMAADMRQATANGRLVLCGSTLLSHPLVSPHLQPALPSSGDLSAGLRTIGLDSSLLADEKQLIWLSPMISGPPRDLPGQSSQISGQWFDGSGTAFESPSSPALLIHHRPQTFQLPDFPAASPFGQQNTHSAHIASVVAAGFRARQPLVRALAERDLQLVAEGGWLLPMGQEAATRRVRQTLQKLPAQPFKQVLQKQPVIIRQARVADEQDNDTHFYVVNTAPWPVTADITIRTARGSQLQLYDDDSGTRSSWEQNQLRWTIELEAFDVRAAWLDNDQAVITDLSVSMPPTIKQQLLAEIHQVNQQAASLAKPQSVDLLSNTDFERTGLGIQPRNWIHSAADDATVQLDRVKPQQGKAALKLHRPATFNRPLWVRSEPFPPPRSGRMAISVWLRIPEGGPQPSLRLAIEAKQSGSVYYRPRTIGKPEAGQDPQSVKPIGSRWTPFLLLVDDLPSVGLSEMRVGFDLMSSGDVWIDNVKIYDIWFQQSEQRELLRNIALAYSHCNEGRVADCEQFLDSYWVQYLREFATPGSTRVARLPAEEASEPPANPASTFDQLRRRYLPSQLFPF